MLTDDALDALNARGERLREALNASPSNAGARHRPRVADDDPRRAARSSSGCCSSSCSTRGHWLASRGMIALSLPITDEQCDEFAAAFAAIVDRLC